MNCDVLFLLTIHRISNMTLEYKLRILAGNVKRGLRPDHQITCHCQERNFALEVHHPQSQKSALHRERTNSLADEFFSFSMLDIIFEDRFLRNFRR